MSKSPSLHPRRFPGHRNQTLLGRLFLHRVGHRPISCTFGAGASPPTLAQPFASSAARSTPMKFAGGILSPARWATNCVKRAFGVLAFYPILAGNACGLELFPPR